MIGATTDRRVNSSQVWPPSGMASIARRCWAAFKPSASVGGDRRTKSCGPISTPWLSRDSRTWLSAWHRRGIAAAAQKHREIISGLHMANPSYHETVARSKFAGRCQQLSAAARPRSCLIAMIWLLGFVADVGAQSNGNVDWPRVCNDSGCMRYSELGQINRRNVGKLKPVWTYHTGELAGRTGKTIECTPIVIDGVMYVTTAYLRVIALDAATGRELWQFDPLRNHPFRHRPTSGGVNRGCAYWSDRKRDGERRILHGTSDGRLFCLDAKTGRLDPRFGDEGILNLRQGLARNVAGLSYGPTSAPAIWRDTIIVGVSC